MALRSLWSWHLHLWLGSEKGCLPPAWAEISALKTEQLNDGNCLLLDEITGCGIKPPSLTFSPALHTPSNALAEALWECQFSLQPQISLVQEMCVCMCMSVSSAMHSLRGKPVTHLSLEGEQMRTRDGEKERVD